MQIFARISLRSAHLGWAVLCLLAPQSSQAQGATDFFGAGDVIADQTSIGIGQAAEAPAAETSEEAAQSMSPKPRRPMPTGSNLLPSPAVFSRQQPPPADLMNIARAIRQQTPTETPNSAHTSLGDPFATDGDDEKEVFRLTNETRAAAGLPALQWDESLANAARHHATDMEADGYFDHDTYDRINGQLVRICSAQERMGLFSPRAAGENIAKGQPTADQVMQTWLASPPHRKGILRADITSVGVGKAGRHWVQNFGW